MRSPLTSLATFSALSQTCPAQAQNSTTDTRVNITALASRNGYSVLECWQIAATGSYGRSATNWIVGGNISQAMYSVIEPRTTPGEAWAPSVQLTAVLNGLIRVTTPSAPPPLNSTVAYMMPGTLSSSLVISADTKETSPLGGHYTEFPSDEKTVLLQLQFTVNEADALEHVVLYDGQCRE